MPTNDNPATYRPEPTWAVNEAQGPTDVDAEQKIIGSCIAFPEIIPEVSSLISTADFSRAPHKVLWDALVRLHDDGKGIDADLVMRSAQVSDDFDRARLSTAYTRALADYVPTPELAADYANRVRRVAVRRRLHVASRSIRQWAADPQLSLDDACALSQDAVQGAVEPPNADGFITLDQAMQNVLDDVRANVQSGAARRFRTGIDPADKRLRMTRSSFVIVGGREGVGKSRLAQAIALNVARRNEPVLIVTTEMPPEEYAERILEADANVAGAALADPQTHEHVEAVEDGISYMEGVPISFLADERADAAIRAIDLRCRGPKKPSMILVDYLQRLTRPESWGRGETPQLKELARRLKNLANRHRVPVVAISMLRRAMQGHDDDPPGNSDLWGGQSLAHEADVVLMMHRPAKDPDWTEFRLTKARRSPDLKKWRMRRAFKQGGFIPEEIAQARDLAASEIGDDDD